MVCIYLDIIQMFLFSNYDYPAKIESFLCLTLHSFNIVKFIIKLVPSLSWFLEVRVYSWMSLSRAMSMLSVIKSPWEFFKSKGRLRTCSWSWERLKTPKECLRLRLRTNWSIHYILETRCHVLVLWVRFFERYFWFPEYEHINFQLRAVLLFLQGLVCPHFFHSRDLFLFIPQSISPLTFSFLKLRNVQLWKY